MSFTCESMCLCVIYYVYAYRLLRHYRSQKDDFKYLFCQNQSWSSVLNLDSLHVKYNIYNIIFFLNSVRRRGGLVVVNKFIRAVITSDCGQ